jgi:hypothetical protein
MRVICALNVDQRLAAKIVPAPQTEGRRNIVCREGVSGDGVHNSRWNDYLFFAGFTRYCANCASVASEISVGR